MSCGDFWFWFMRPFAEFLGAIALLAAIGAPILAFVAALNWQAKRGKRR